MDSRSGDAERELDGFYAATYRRLVRVVTAVTGDATEAEDAVMDAFVRLMGQWDKVSRYDDPEAFVRKIALGMVSNRRRKIRNGLRAVLQHGPAPDVQPPTADRIDIHRAMAVLSRPQREVIVLTDLGLDIESVARQLDIPLGTAKSRLARARAALAPQLREAHDHV